MFLTGACFRDRVYVTSTLVNHARAYFLVGCYFGGNIASMLAEFEDATNLNSKTPKQWNIPVLFLVIPCLTGIGILLSREFCRCNQIPNSLALK